MDLDLDGLLIQRMRRGDEDALNAFVTKYYPAILKYCHLHIGDYGYAQDMTQETFTRFFRNLKQYRHYGKAANYLYVIAGNVCRDYHRQNREMPVEKLPEVPNGSMESPEARTEVWMALESLPEEIREVAILYFVQERKQKDIAAVLGIGLPLVKYRVGRARELLRAFYDISP